MQILFGVLRLPRAKSSDMVGVPVLLLLALQDAAQYKQPPLLVEVSEVFSAPRIVVAAVLLFPAPILLPQDPAQYEQPPCFVKGLAVVRFVSSRDPADWTQFPNVSQVPDAQNMPWICHGGKTFPM